MGQSGLMREGIAAESNCSDNTDVPKRHPKVQPEEVTERLSTRA